MLRRAAPAFALFFLSPLVAEFLLGDFTLAALPVLFFLAPLYGGGALLIREVARRTGRGWPAMALLALAYGVLEEGIFTQSLFNPDYAGHHLLSRGFVPALGIAVPWTLYVLALHTVWSISVPIALAESGTRRRTTPWLRTPGLIVTVVLFLVGAALTTVFSWSSGHFWASWPQLVTVVVIAAVLVVAAFLVPPVPKRTPTAPPWALLLLTVAGGALFMGGMRLDTVPAVIAILVSFAAVLTGLIAWARTPAHVLAAAAGGVLTYAWHSFFLTPLQGDGPVITPVSHVVFVLAAVFLVTVLWRRRAWSDEVHGGRSSGGAAGDAGRGGGGDALVRGPSEAAARAEG
ncbi:hypothetical protein AB0M20_26555 [Actinoplanes sp. NPDC051633]|uniref:hypothetical protein n=1 Tax=Actinoplanes sp. NPDC051633 TaxID=3155670 RepID=UPI003438809F